MTKISAKKLKVKTYRLLEKAVEDGVECGWRRAHKHVDTPGEDAIKQQIIENVLQECCEWFSFTRCDY